MRVRLFIGALLYGVSIFILFMATAFTLLYQREHLLLIATTTAFFVGGYIWETERAAEDTPYKGRQDDRNNGR